MLLGMYKNRARQPVLFKEMKCLDFNKKKGKKGERKFHPKLVSRFQNNADPKNLTKQLRPLLSKVRINGVISILIWLQIFCSIKAKKNIVYRVKIVVSFLWDHVPNKTVTYHPCIKCKSYTPSKSVSSVLWSTDLMEVVSWRGNKETKWCHESYDSVKKLW